MRDAFKNLLKRPLTRYCAAIIAVAVAFLLREGLARVTGPDFPEYVLFYPTVMIVALMAGLWPAMLAIGTAASLITFFWILPGHGLLSATPPGNFVGLILFMGVGLFLSFVAELYRRSRAKAAAYDKEQSLRESQAAIRRQADLLKLSFDAIIVRRMTGEIESWNRGAEELYGYTEAEAQGRKIHELLHSSTSVPLPEFETMLRTSGQWDGEVRHVTKDGREVIVSSRQHMGSGPDGKERVLKIDRDITDQKRAQAELLRAHEELEAKVQERTADLSQANRMLMMVGACDQALVENTDERELMAMICQIIQGKGGYPLVWVGLLDNGSGLLRCVSSAGDRDGFYDSVIAAGGESALGAGLIDQAIRSCLPVLSNDIADMPPETPWRRAALDRGFHAVAALPLLNLQKTSFGALVIYADRLPGFDASQMKLLRELVDDLAFGITSLRARVERDQAQRSLELKASQLRMLAGEIVKTEQRERRRIAQLLHDNLQQLLAAALYGAEGLRTTRSAEEAAESIAQLGKLLRECIGISRSLTSELSHPSLSEPDLGTALEWLASWMKERHGLDVEVTAADAVTMEAEETRIMLMQAIRELLFNVVKHSGVKSARVRLEKDRNGSVRISVSDDGVGFDPARISSLGGRVNSIGLFSIRERLALTGGGMEAITSPGHGSCFTVWVPETVCMAQEPPPPSGRSHGVTSVRPTPSGEIAVPPPAAMRGHGPERIRVLLVDDHAVVRDGLALQLRQQPDIEIVGEASDGESAIRLARSLGPDVVTMDVSMPGMSGIATTRILHAEFPGVSIVGLSMFDEPKQAAAMREAGAVEYLSKSASLDSLLAAIRRAAAGSV